MRAGSLAGWLGGTYLCTISMCFPAHNKHSGLPSLRSPRPPFAPTPSLQVNAAITYLRSENMCYPACTNKVDGTRQCNKKLQDNGDGTWCGAQGGGCHGCRTGMQRGGFWVSGVGGQCCASAQQLLLPRRKGP